MIFLLMVFLELMDGLVWLLYVFGISLLISWSMYVFGVFFFEILNGFCIGGMVLIFVIVSIVGVVNILFVF